MPDFSKYTPSALTLIAANLIPLFGAVFLGWDAFAIVLLYWAENVIIGAINVLKMLTCRPDPNEVNRSKLSREAVDDPQLQTFLKGMEQHGALVKSGHLASQIFLVPFFTVHYGMFCLIHGVFVFVMLGRDDFFGPLEMPREFWRVAVDEHLIWGLAALAGSHLCSFFTNYIGRGEYRRTAAPLLMMQPYGRVVVLHVAILFGGFVTTMFGSPVLLLVLLVIGKTILDLKLHLRERRRNAADGSQGLPHEILAEPPGPGSD